MAKLKTPPVVFHVHILHVFETNQYKYVLEVFICIYVGIFAYTFVLIHVQTGTYIYQYLHLSLC